jgi:cold shock CspA family protein
MYIFIHQELIMTQNQTTQVSESVTLIDTTSYVGQVKWFNNRLGYGFITIVSECERRNEDIFVHQQHITPQTSDYRSLQQGEYVSFQLGRADADAKHVTQAVNVTGVFGGPLMCDQIPRRNAPPATREEGSRKNTKPVTQSSETTSQPQTSGPRGPRGGAPRGTRGGARSGTRGGRQQAGPTTASETQ